jgi:dTDP-glucose 4,6-dehydratase
MKNLLITGGAGFIGSNFIEYFLTQYSDYRIINLDKLTYAGDLNNLSEVQKYTNYEFVNGDIRNRPFVDTLFRKYQFIKIYDAVI